MTAFDELVSLEEKMHAFHEKRTTKWSKFGVSFRGQGQRFAILRFGNLAFHVTIGGFTIGWVRPKEDMYRPGINGWW